MSKLTLDEQKQRQQEYWSKRMEQLEASLHRDAEETVRDLETMYRAAEREIEADLSRWYGRFGANNGVVTMADARKLLTSGELKEFKWTLAEYREKAKDNADGKWQKELENASARWHVSRLEALKYQLQQHVEVLAGGQTDAMDVLLKNTYLNGYGQTAFTIQTGLGIGFDIAGLNGRAIQVLLNKPWTTDGRNFSERIWGNKQVLIGELHKQLTQNLMTGGDLNKLIDTMSQKFNTSRSNAARLVYTEHAYAVSVASGESYRATGVEKVTFIATLDERTSEICQSMDGTIIDMKDYQPGVTVPPLHPYCRSTTAPYYADMAGIGERAARDEDGNTYYVPRDMTYPEWADTFLKDPDTGESGSKDGLTPVGDTSTLAGFLASLPKIQGEHSYKDDERDTNPRYEESRKKGNTEYTHNCQRCVNAYEARRRGYDVTAAARLPGNDDLAVMMAKKGWANVYESGRESLVPVTSRTTEGVKAKVIETVKSMGSGARVIVRVQWKRSYSGHVFIAENHDGEVVFLDPQDETSDAGSYFSYAKVNQTHLLRIDDKEFTDLIRKCVVPRKDESK